MTTALHHKIDIVPKAGGWLVRVTQQVFLDADHEKCVMSRTFDSEVLNTERKAHIHALNVKAHIKRELRNREQVATDSPPSRDATGGTSTGRGDHGLRAVPGLTEVEARER